MDKNNLPEGFTYCNITDRVSYDCDGTYFNLNWESFGILKDHPEIIEAYDEKVEVSCEDWDKLAKIPVKD